MAAGLVLGVGGCAAQQGRSELIRISEGLFDAMARRDAELARELTLPQGVFVSVRGEPGDRRTDVTPITDWIRSLPDRGPDVVETFLEPPRAVVKGDVAVLWAEFALDVEGERSHTGTDIFTFVRTDRGWKLATATYDVIPPTRSDAAGVNDRPE